VDAARAVENFSASRRGERSGTHGWVPARSRPGQVRAESVSVRNRATPGRSTIEPAHSLQRSFTSPPTQVRPAEASSPGSRTRIGPSAYIDAGQLHTFLLSHPQPNVRSLTRPLAHRRRRRTSSSQSAAELIATPSPSESTEGSISLCVAADANGVPSRSFERRVTH